MRKTENPKTKCFSRKTIVYETAAVGFCHYAAPSSSAIVSARDHMILTERSNLTDFSGFVVVPCFCAEQKQRKKNTHTQLDYFREIFSYLGEKSWYHRRALSGDSNLGPRLVFREL